MLRQNTIRYNLYFLCTICFFSFFSCRDQSEPEIFLITENYNGSVAILFNQSDGKVEEYENGKRIYRIPNDGILKTKFQKTIHGKLTQEYFYLNKEGDKIAELETYSHGDYDTDKKYIMNGEYGNFNNSSELSKNRTYFRIFSVGDVDEINNLKKLNNEFLEKIKIELTTE